ncbi:4-diphosphocytidyl-2-C-methyl-D-erythritol kinase [Sinobacterium caligoides]|uniref:4-diphosphocytidyl-2-C-methyl-D-erythritol kinase n=1 Tax=Sinobacterium caligoides TaxID=933926 RepID=A0A3N2E0Z3_9GAMM|nr:4-(cytidine 5'-diphospho)-2-C-methyl-D-erythritol kinase [Sinobacterium caligoides]ROS05778.1 4-diphosphocytidyl-2-C-methyl-D-erythritol kinase [Sinobacterium caligoides]
MSLNTRQNAPAHSKTLWALSLPAPAKLNLMLHITGRRTDGYHQLQTVFQFLDYSDQLYFNQRDDNSLNLLTEFPGLAASDNLIIRAAQLLQQHTGCTLGADIAIDKRLPAGGGLGGGSSDAATTLVALNRLWQCGLNTEQLANLGLTLGADVPIFIHGFAAWAEGVGEQLQAITPVEHYFLVIHPCVHVSTGEVFSHKDLTRDSKPIKFATALVGEPRNDCQSLVSELYPEVGRALTWASQFGPTLMTGAGACIFSHFDDLSKAEDIQRQVPGNWQSFVAKGTNRSALYRALHTLNE